MAWIARLLATAALLAMSACSGGSGSSDLGGRASAWKLENVSVRYGPTISRTASGQEYDSNFVWNGYGGGNRKRQVIGIVKQGVSAGANKVMQGGQPVDIRVQINVFHALTDFGRAWCCGLHTVDVDLEVVDKATGRVLESEKGVDMTTIAYGGFVAAAVESAGYDQGTRIIHAIENGTHNWLRGG